MISQYVLIWQSLESTINHNWVTHDRLGNVSPWLTTKALENLGGQASSRHLAEG